MARSDVRSCLLECLLGLVLIRLVTSFSYGHHGFGGFDLVYHQYCSFVAPYTPGDDMLYISVLSGDQSTEPCIQLRNIYRIIST